ncbi:hypothetical protein [Streptomyces apocyni]|uniref:hypothetical protein n=1 Tax=Streptomyces apocyni TaxID=2654677 RepID=UPI001E4874F4|nr:hypothetical protein [Streptomyces apocyni]
MLRHVNAPTRRYTKASHDVVRHPRLNSDAKILLLYVQGLPDDATGKSLGEHAASVGLKGRAYQRAKELLTACGYLHEWRYQDGRGRWATDQVLGNITLTREDADRLRGGVSLPSTRNPTVGESTGRMAGGSLPKDEEREKNTPHPPPEREPERGPEPELEPDGGAVPSPELVEAERVLLSLRHAHRDLWLGLREARTLAGAAAEWLRRGFTAGDLRQALTRGLPPGGVRSAVGFVRHRLAEKLPAPELPVPKTTDVAEAADVVTPAGLVVCAGPGDEHVFRPVSGEECCARCRVRDARGGGVLPVRRSYGR